MDEVNYLEKTEKVGNVFKCPCGNIHINLKGVSLHFSEEAFMGFAYLIRNACSKFIEKGLSEITGQNKNE